MPKRTKIIFCNLVPSAIYLVLKYLKDIEADLRLV